MSKLQPNFFQRRWEWHSRVVDFEKKFEKIHPPRRLQLKVPETKPKCRGGGGNGDNDKNLIYLSTVKFGASQDVLEVFATLKVPETKPKCRGGGGGGNGDHYKNRIYMSTVNCGGVKTYLVTLKLDNSEDLYDDVEETKEFNTEADAMRCFQETLKLKTLLPQTAHRIFLDYGK